MTHVRYDKITTVYVKFVKQRTILEVLRTSCVCWCIRL